MRGRLAVFAGLDMILFLAFSLMCFRYARVSADTHQAFADALRRAEASGDQRGTRVLNADYVLRLKDQNRSLNMIVGVLGSTFLFHGIGLFVIRRNLPPSGNGTTTDRQLTS
jgi:hypothetical protein